MEMKGLFDTNIIIDFLNGVLTAKTEIELYAHKYISIITYIEVLVGVSNSQNEEAIKEFLQSFEIVNIDLEVANYAILVRKQFKLKVPDSLIIASAQKIGAILITRNTKDFSKNIPIVRIPYQL